MALSISAPVGAWEDPVVMGKHGNRRDDVIAVQTLLTRAAQSTGNGLLDPHGIDGAIAHAPKQSNTLEALGRFQKRFLAKPDRRVDVAGRTWEELKKYDDPKLGDGAGAAQLATYEGQVVPFFTQFDSAWGQRKLSTKSLKSKGCAVTSIAMILKFFGRDMDPGKLDEHLDEHSGYSGNNVIWATALKAGEAVGKPKLKISQSHFTDAARFSEVLSERLGKNWPTLAHVDYGNDAGTTGDHWVVVVGRTAAGRFIINDPGTSEGNGAANPQQQVTILGESTRKGGLNLVRLCLFDVT